MLAASEFTSTPYKQIRIPCSPPIIILWFNKINSQQTFGPVPAHVLLQSNLCPNSTSCLIKQFNYHLLQRNQLISQPIQLYFFLCVFISTSIKDSGNVGKKNNLRYIWEIKTDNVIKSINREKITFCFSDGVLFHWKQITHFVKVNIYSISLHSISFCVYSHSRSYNIYIQLYIYCTDKACLSNLHRHGITFRSILNMQQILWLNL